MLRSQSAKTESSRPTRNSSARSSSDSSTASPKAMSSARSSDSSTPLPAARPLFLSTSRAPAVLVDETRERLHVGESRGAGAGHAPSLREGAREGLARLERGGLLRRAEGGHARLLERVHEAGGEGPFGTHDDEADPQLAGGRDDGLRDPRDRAAGSSRCLGARVARRAVDEAFFLRRVRTPSRRTRRARARGRPIRRSVLSRPSPFSLDRVEEPHDGPRIDRMLDPWTLDLDFFQLFPSSRQ